MIWLLLCILPVALFWMLDLLCGAEPPKVLRRLGQALARTARRSPLHRRRRRRRQGVDVFDVLRVQSRLGAVADEILRLEHDRGVYAKAARLRATHRAYDDLLAEACRLAEVRPVEVTDSGPASIRTGVHDARAHAELELASRGWSW